MKRLALIGCGNVLMKDDGIGVYIVREIKKRSIFKDIDIIDAGTPGIDLIDIMRLYDEIIIVDSMRSGINAGSVKEINLSELNSLKTSLTSLHGLDLILAVKVATGIGAKALEIKIIGVEAKEVNSFEEGLSTEIKEKFNLIVEKVISKLRKEGFT